MKVLREAVKKGGIDHEALASKMSRTDLHKLAAHWYHQGHHEIHKEMVDDGEEGMVSHSSNMASDVGHSTAEMAHEVHKDSFDDIEHHIHKLAKHYAKKY